MKEVEPFISQDHIFGSGIKWENSNLEGINYRIPVICNRDDLENFLEGKRLRKKGFKLEKERSKNYYTTADQISFEQSGKLKDIPEVKILQFSYLYFVDPIRCVFYSNPSVRYDTDYNPIINNELSEIELAQTGFKARYTRGYYYWNSQFELHVELRASLKESSIILIFRKDHLEDDLLLEEVRSFKIKKVSTPSGPQKIQVLEKQIDVLNNFPDISTEPKAYRIKKRIPFKFENQNIDSIVYEVYNQQIHGFSSELKFVRRYWIKDSTIVEPLDKTKNFSW